MPPSGRDGRKGPRRSQRRKHPPVSNPKRRGKLSHPPSRWVKREPKKEETSVPRRRERIPMSTTRLSLSMNHSKLSTRRRRTRPMEQIPRRILEAAKSQKFLKVQEKPAMAVPAMSRATILPKLSLVTSLFHQSIRERPSMERPRRGAAAKKPIPKGSVFRSSIMRKKEGASEPMIPPPAKIATYISRAAGLPFPTTVK